MDQKNWISFKSSKVNLFQETGCTTKKIQGTSTILKDLTHKYLL